MAIQKSNVWPTSLALLRWCMSTNYAGHIPGKLRHLPVTRQVYADGRPDKITVGRGMVPPRFFKQCVELGLLRQLTQELDHVWVQPYDKEPFWSVYKEIWTISKRGEQVYYEDPTART